MQQLCEKNIIRYYLGNPGNPGNPNILLIIITFSFLVINKFRNK